MAEWPLGNRDALSLTFDNLGEAAEAQLGAIPMPEGPIGEHFTAREVLPALLPELRKRMLKATFFVEGINADLYPDVLAMLPPQGHEVGYHAWCHEEWAGLTEAEQVENLALGLAAFERCSLRTAGMRPPGGLLGAGGVDALHEAGLRYCSPAGEGVGVDDGFVLLPFQWQHVDATCVLPPLAPVRERMAGSPEPLEPAAFVSHLEGAIDRLASEGGYMPIVLHLAMIREWLGAELLGALLDRVERAAKFEDVWVAPCAKVAAHVLANPERFEGEATLDTVSWASGGG